MNSTDASTPAIVDTPVAGSVGLFLDKVARRYRTALNRFFERRTLALAYDSEDLTQEVFARLAGRRDCQDIAQVEQYLFRTAQNVLIDHHRRGTVRQAGAHDCYDEDAHAVEDFSVEHVLIVREQVDVVSRCLESLPDAVRMTLILHRFEEMSYAEIAQRLGVSVSSVEKYMMRALRELTQAYKGSM